MPNFDKTGPNGNGSQTGGKRGIKTTPTQRPKDGRGKGKGQNKNT
jgi:hypothetical protein